jgi:hypothetical protein
VLTSVLAFFAAGFAGEMVAQAFAVWSGATEEYVLVFAATALFATVVTVPLFVAQFLGDPLRAANRAAVWTLAAFVPAFRAGRLDALRSGRAARLGWRREDPRGPRAARVAIILVQRLIVRWRLPRVSQPQARRFGRNGLPT